MNRYDDYKPTGIEWIGNIPAHWEVKAAKYCFKYTTGFTPPTGQEEFYNGDITWITIADMNGKSVDESTTTLSQMAIEKYKPELTIKGALLYSFKLSVGKVAFANKDLYTNEAIISILPDETYDVRYFYYTLPEQLLKNANENIYGAKILNQELIRNAIITFPPKYEQTSIANYLDYKTAQIDKLITRKQQLIELLTEEKLALINNVVTRGLDETVELKKTSIEWVEGIPYGWNVKKLKHVVSQIVDTEHKTIPFYENGDYSVARTSDVRHGILSVNSMKRTNEDGYLQWTKRAIPEEGDVLFTREAPAGEACIVPASIKICLGQRMVLFKVIGDVIISEYLVYIIYSSVVREYINQLSQGTTVLHFNMGDIKNIPIVFPKLKEQKRIIEVIITKTKAIDETIKGINQEISLIQEYRTSLISEVITGKIKVLDVPITISIPSCQVALAAEIMQQLAAEKTFGRVKFQKILYLCEYYGQLAGIGSNYQRAAAGPLDDALLSTIEKELRASQWFDTASAPSKKFTERIVYSPLPKAAQYEKWYNKYWADSDENIQRIIATLRFANTDTCEMIATLFAAWNDLIIKGFGQPADDAIITEVYNWHIKKQRFPKPEWQKELSFMRKHHLIPTGFGKPTTTA